MEYLKKEEIDASELMVLSLDAEALYPSLDVEDVAKACAKQVVSSSLEIEGVNWMWAATYVALAFEEDQTVREGLHGIMPRRKSRQGNEPTVLTIKEVEKRNRWR